MPFHADGATAAIRSSMTVVYCRAGGTREERGFATEHDRAPCHSQHVRFLIKKATRADAVTNKGCETTLFCTRNPAGLRLVQLTPFSNIYDVEPGSDPEANLHAARSAVTYTYIAR